MLLAFGAVLALTAGSASAVATHRALQQTSTDALCSWDGSSKCSGNGQLLYEMGALGEDLQSSERAFWSCFDENAPYTACDTTEVAATAVAAPPTTTTMTPVPFKFTSEAADDTAAAPLPSLPGGLPDYSIPTKCPYANGRVNPMTSGDLPDEWVHPDNPPDFTPFSADDTPVENETVCDLEAPATERSHGQVLMKDPETGLCTSCPEAKCTVWLPDFTGHYKPHCTGVIPLSDMADFYLNFPIPGDEEEAGWGPDANPHVHFKCEGCGGVIFNKWMPLPTDQYCEISPTENMKMSAPNDSNEMNSVAIGSGEPGMFYLIMQENWQMISSKKDLEDNACWTTTNANPCPEYATNADGADCAGTDGPGTTPEPDEDPILVPKTGGAAMAPPPVATVAVEMTGCAVEGYDYAATKYDISSAHTLDAELCASMCSTTDACDAAVFFASGKTNCYLKKGALTAAPSAIPAGAVERTLIYMSTCAELTGTEKARKLSQAGSTCTSVKLSATESACTAEGAFLGEAAAAETFEAAMPVLRDVRGFKASCPHSDFLAGNVDADCTAAWSAYLQVIGCETCLADIDMASSVVTSCSTAGTEDECITASETARSTAAATPAAKLSGIDLNTPTAIAATATTRAVATEEATAAAATEASAATNTAVITEASVVKSGDDDDNGWPAWQIATVACGSGLILIGLIAVAVRASQKRSGMMGSRGASGPYVSQPLDLGHSGA